MDGRSRLSIDLPDDDLHRIADVAPTGAAFVEIDDLFWEINEGWLYLLGTFPTADGAIDLDLEIACTGPDGAPIDTDTGIDVGTAAGGESPVRRGATGLPGGDLRGRRRSLLRLSNDIRSTAAGAVIDGVGPARCAPRVRGVPGFGPNRPSTTS